MQPLPLPKGKSPAQRALNFDPTLPGQAMVSESPESEADEHNGRRSQQARHSCPEDARKGLAISDELDTTEYYIPPGASPFGPKLRHNASSLLSLPEAAKKPAEAAEQDNGTTRGLTVRELLTDFTERMRVSLDLSRSLNDQSGHTEPKVPLLELDKLEELSELSSGELDMTHEGTLVDCGEQEAVTPSETVPAHLTGGTSPALAAMYSGSVSRYSMTDYFQKYPDTKSERNDFVGISTQHVDQALRDDSKVGDELDLGARTRVPLMQGSLYKGTALDTSLSTINAVDVVSVGSTNSATSTASLDDRMFREGLARLDADIAKIQQTLRQVPA